MTTNTDPYDIEWLRLERDNLLMENMTLKAQVAAITAIADELTAENVQLVVQNVGLHHEAEALTDANVSLDDLATHLATIMRDHLSDYTEEELGKIQASIAIMLATNDRLKEAGG